MHIIHYAILDCQLVLYIVSTWHCILRLVIAEMFRCLKHLLFPPQWDHECVFGSYHWLILLHVFSCASELSVDFNWPAQLNALPHIDGLTLDVVSSLLVHWRSKQSIYSVILYSYMNTCHNWAGIGRFWRSCDMFTRVISWISLSPTSTCLASEPVSEAGVTYSFLSQEIPEPF